MGPPSRSRRRRRRRKVSQSISPARLQRSSKAAGLPPGDSRRSTCLIRRSRLVSEHKGVCLAACTAVFSSSVGSLRRRRQSRNPRMLTGKGEREGGGKDWGEKPDFVFPLK